MTNTIKVETVAKVLEMSKYDIYIEDVLTEFDEEQDEEILEFIEEYEEEFGEFLSTALKHVMTRLKIRMAYAKNGEDK